LIFRSLIVRGIQLLLRMSEIRLMSWHVLVYLKARSVPPNPLGSKNISKNLLKKQRPNSQSG
jgi:hypothetical protein